MHQESNGERHVQSTFRLDLDGLHLWPGYEDGGVVSARERRWSQLTVHLSIPDVSVLEEQVSGLPLQAGSNITPISPTHSVLTTRLCLSLTLTHFCHQNTSGPSGNQAVPVPCFENSLKEHSDPQKEAVNVTFNIYD